MGLFDKIRQTRPAPAASPSVGPGSRVRTRASVSQCVAVLDNLLSAYRPRQYRHLPHLVDCGHVWHATGAKPDRVMCFFDHEENFILTALWDMAAGSEAGIFTLHPAQQHPDQQPGGASVVAAWGMRDPSLATVGSISAGAISIREPDIPSDYVESTLQAAGYPCTASNLVDLHDMMVRQHLIRAHELISAEDPVFADAFVERHKLLGHLPTLVRELGTWNVATLPYIQDLPWRVRAILLEPDTLQHSSFWAALEQSR